MSITQIIKKAKENPLLVFAWSFVGLAVGYIIKHEASFPDRADYLEQANVQINAEKAELEKAVLIFDLYKGASTKSDSLFLQLLRDPDLSSHAPTRLTVMKLLDAIEKARDEISKSLVFVNTTDFHNQRLLDIKNTIRNNIQYVDSINEKGYNFFSLVLQDENNLYKDNNVKYGLKEERKGLEIQVSDYAIEEQLETVRQEINAKVRTAQRKADLFKRESNLFIVACTYVAAFFGGCLGYLISLRKKRKKNKGSTSPSGS